MKSEREQNQGVREIRKKVCIREAALREVAATSE